MNYSNKVLLITGASSGIGAATAKALGKHNNKIFITARREERLRDVAQMVRSEGSECHYFCGDAGDEEHGRYVVDQIIKTCGRIDLAILNVGIGPPSNTLTANPEKIKKCMEANFHTMIHFYCPLMEVMKKQKEKSMIVHMNSQATWFAIPMQGDYTAAKAACRIFFDTARMELKHFGLKHIRLQTAHPGFVATEAVKDDGIPAPNEISEDQAAAYILKGIEKEWRENVFPRGTKWATQLGKILPWPLLTRALLSQTPADY